MSSDFLQILSVFPRLIWSIFTSFKIPGLNFTPAVLFFGILSFGVAIKFVTGIIDITSHGVSNEVSSAARNRRRQSNEE